MNNHRIFIGKFEIELPEYMVSLNQQQINDILRGENPQGKILACGVHSDGSVTIITSDCEVKVFHPEKFYVPLGIYLPTVDGDEVHLPNTANRWPGISRDFYVKSSWMIENSASEIDNATLQINNRYIGDIDLNGSQSDNT